MAHPTSKLYLLGLLAIICVACGAPQTKIAGQGYIHHVVIVWLKQPGDQQARQQLFQDSKLFSEIPGVIAVTAGTTFASERSVVDDSFDIALTVILKDRAALQNYQDHPLHASVKRQLLKPLVAKYKVYNYVD